MPATLTKAGILEVVYKGEDRGQAVINVLHYRIPDSSDDATIINVDTWLAAAHTQFKAFFQPLNPATYLLNTVSASIITGRVANPRPQPNPIGSWTPFILTYGAQAELNAGQWQGTLLGDQLTSFTAAGYRHITLLRGRRFRGGNRYDVGTEASTEPATNLWAVGFYGNLTAAGYMNKVINVTDTGPPVQLLVMCVFGRRSYLQDRTVPSPTLRSYSSEVVNFSVNRFVTSQVSRKQRQRLA